MIYRCFLLLSLLWLPLALGGQDSLAYWEARAEHFWAQGETDSLGHCYRRIAKYCREADELAGFVYAYWDWQAAVFEDSKTALALLDEAAAQAWRPPADAEEAEAFLWLEVNRGYHRFQLGQVQAAVQAYERAWQNYRAHRFAGFELLEYLCLPLGAHYTRLGDNEKARVLYEQAISEAPEQTEPGTLAGLYNNLGLTYWNEGRQAEAIAVYRKGLSIPSLPPGKAGLLCLSLGQSCLDLGDWDAAGRHAQRAESALSASASDGELRGYRSSLLLLQGKLASQAGDHQRAVARIGLALDHGLRARGGPHHRSIAKLHIAQGEAWQQAGKPERALAAYNQALHSLFPNFPVAAELALPDSSLFYEENAIAEALAGKAAALGEMGGPQRLQAALRCHQLASQAAWQLRGALQYESSRINLLSQSRARIANAIGLCRQAYEGSGDDHYLYLAWGFAEELKSTVLLDAVRRNRFANAAMPGDSSVLAMQRLRKQLAYFERELLLYPEDERRPAWRQQRDALLEQLQAAAQQLMAQQPAWAALEQGPGDVASLLAGLPPGKAVIEYFVGVQGVDIFALPPAGPPVWARVAGSGELTSQVQALLALLRSRQQLETQGAAYAVLAHQVYQALLAPIAEAIGGLPPELLIVPDAWLSALPFEALYTQPAPDAPWALAPFLLRGQSVQYAFSLAVLRQQQQPALSGRRLMLHCAPQFEERQRGLPPLLQSEAELPKAWRQGRAHYAGEAATWAAFQQAAPSYRILHLSTHAAADGAQPPRVELYDRSAYLPDIYALPLNAELVVLSACETGLGEFQTGEGVMSLSRAFAYAGARGLISSLWPINESATAGLLYRTYERLATGVSKPLALHRAKLAYLDDGQVPAFQQSPYYWAGLVYVGDGQPVPLPAKRWPFGWLLAVGALAGLAGYWLRWRSLQKDS